MIVPYINWKRVWNSFWRKLGPSIRRNKIKTFLVVILLPGFAFLSDVLGVWSFLQEKAGTENLLGAVFASRDSINSQTQTSEENILRGIDGIDGISCRNLEGGDWVIDEAFSTERQLLLLKNGETAGSIRLFGSFADTFILKFIFEPAAIEGTNATFSIKDELNNELSVSFGDSSDLGSGNRGLNYYSVSFKKNGLETDVGNPTGPQKIVPPVKDSTEVTFQLETTQKANDISANAFILYSPSKKPSEIAKQDLFQNSMPYFSDRKTRLHLGLRRMFLDQEPGITIVDCEIREKTI